MRHSGTPLRRGAKGLCPAGAPALLDAALLAAALLTAAFLTACGGGRSSANSQVPVQSSGNPVDQIIAKKAAEASATAPADGTVKPEGTSAPPDGAVKPEGTAAAEEVSASDPWLQEDYVYEPPENMSHDGIDVDLTVLSPTMVYAEVFNMISYAPDYVGKKIRMQGPAVSYTDAEIGKTYYACLIQDATACCATGLEYVLPEGSEYPEDDEEIIVTGVFDTYVDVDGIEYCRLLDAVMGTDEAGKG